jgi:predicted transcriptional regulator
MKSKPTSAELEILQILWRLGPVTVREVHAELPGKGYTTLLKLMQIMAEKGLVERDESARAHVYAAAYREDETKSQLLRDLLDRAFGGSPALLVQQALSARKATRKELAEIREILQRYERGSK